VERQSEELRDYERATQRMHGYIIETRKQRDGATDPVWRAQLTGRIEAITYFNNTLLSIMAERMEDE
jgi:hypothetical protein